jgi:FixJ family two-component response regulator
VRISGRGAAKNYVAHATTALKRVHRPQSSLRTGYLLASGRGRFFLQLTHALVATARPIVAVIEADATDRRTLCSLLSSLDVDVQDYDSAESYLAARIDGFRCLITDVSLPGMSGLELLRHMRSRTDSRAERLPVILLGEESDVRAAVTAMREGAVDFIEKPHVDIAIARRVAYLLDHASELTH